MLLYCKKHIQMTSNDNTKMWKQKTIESAQKDKIIFNTNRIYITIYITYLLLRYKGHI